MLWLCVRGSVYGWIAMRPVKVWAKNFKVVNALLAWQNMATKPSYLIAMVLFLLNMPVSARAATEVVVGEHSLKLPQAKQAAVIDAAPIDNIKVTGEAKFARGERCYVDMVLAKPAAKLVLRSHALPQQQARVYDYGYRFAYDFSGFYSPYREMGRQYGVLLTRKNAQTQNCRRLQRWLHQSAQTITQVPARFPLMTLPSL